MPSLKTYVFVNEPARILYKWGWVSDKINGKFVSNNQYFNSARYWDLNKDGNQAYWGTSQYLNDFGPTAKDLNRLYGKIKEKITGPQGELLTSALEWKGSLGMITKRVVQIGSAYSAVKKLRFTEAAKILGMSTSQTRLVKRRILVSQGVRENTSTRSKTVKRVSTIRREGTFSPTSAWLEYWMGWAPLHGDIAHAIKTIGAAEPQSMHFSVGVKLDESPEILLRLNQTSGETRWDTTITSIKSGSYSAYGGYRIVNHNAFVLNQLGLINPALTVWQLVPFSFIVDWFANIGTVIGSLTDFAGIEFVNTGYAMKGEVNVTVKSKYSWEWGDYYHPRQWYSESYSGSGVGRYSKRDPGPLQGPTLRVGMLDKLSLTRAATSISLLTEIFLKR